MRDLVLNEIESVSGGWLNADDLMNPYGNDSRSLTIPGGSNPFGFSGSNEGSGGSGPNTTTTTGPTSDENGDVNGWGVSVESDTNGDGNTDWDASADTNGNYEAGYTFENGVRIGGYIGGGGNSGGVTITVPLGGR